MPVRIGDQLLAAPKGHTAGTHRTRSPAATLQAYRPLMPRLGITRLADVTGLDVVGIPVVQAVRPNARSVSVSQGKGVDREAAAASALMEAIEAWHGEHVAVPLRYERATALRREGEAVVDLHRLPRRADAEVREDLPLLWCRGWDLLQDRPTWVPHACVSIDFVRDPREPLPPFIESTSGLASGNHLLEAIVHALCELIERDATARSAGAADDASRVDLAGVTDPSCRAVLERLTAASMLVGAVDITSDVGVPAFACRIVDQPGAPRWAARGACGGYGCHLDPAVALLRALTEAVQTRLTLIAGSRDDLSFKTYEAFTDPQGSADEAAVLAAGLGRRALGSTSATDSFEGDLELLLGRLRATGCSSAVLVDLTRAEIGVPVARMIVPGLEGRFSGMAPGARARAREGT
ncbi:YcaO-like family protein [Nannocystis sp. SCPEA4]|uniref:YcaO-like family protein n=1 Tax=Nannocystis sp. SCPEA4 TaxID=2996787 RepID=UPI0022702414|nr:YcaO-like family protein [Nannocystis sp. SCPEA4]MCY1058146.1 YcaO-like family protein [Nannocystis sp. SCPEA4]